MARNLKDALHALAEQLPASATWKDVLYEDHFRQEVEAGLAEADYGEFATDDEVKAAFAKWGGRLKLKWTRRVLHLLVEAQEFIARDSPAAAQSVAARINDLAPS